MTNVPSKSPKTFEIISHKDGIAYINLAIVTFLNTYSENLSKHKLVIGLSITGNETDHLVLYFSTKLEMEKAAKDLAVKLNSFHGTIAAAMNIISENN